MSIIQENSEIPEMFLLRHKHDTRVDEHGYDYQKNLLQRSVSKTIYNNENASMFLDKLNDMMVSITDSILPVRNLFFFTHDKYYNKHGR